MQNHRTEQSVTATVATVAPFSCTNAGEARKRILVIDDDPVILKTLSITLKSGGYDVMTTNESAAALSLMHDWTPDVLLVDIGLAPDVDLHWDGFQVAQWIRRMNGKIPTIMISGSATAEFVEQSAANGAQGFFAKPIDKNLLLKTIGSVLSEASTDSAAGNN